MNQTHPLESEELIPISNVFLGRMCVRRRELVSLCVSGKVRLVGEQGKERAVWVFDDAAYDAAVFSPKGADPTRAIGHNSRYDVEQFSGSDAFPGMPVLTTIGYERRTAA